MKESIESRLNFSEQEKAGAVKLMASKNEDYYQAAFVEYCEKNGIDYSEDNCSAMIMTDYIPDGDHYYFWIE